MAPEEVVQALQAKRLEFARRFTPFVLVASLVSGGVGVWAAGVAWTVGVPIVIALALLFTLVARSMVSMHVIVAGERRLPVSHVDAVDALMAVRGARAEALAGGTALHWSWPFPTMVWVGPADDLSVLVAPHDSLEQWARLAMRRLERQDSS